MERITTHVGFLERDDEHSRVRFLGLNGPLARDDPAFPFIRNGMPICVEAADKDAGGWFDYEPGTFRPVVGRNTIFRHTAENQARGTGRTYRGGVIESIEPV